MAAVNCQCGFSSMIWLANNGQWHFFKTGNARRGCVPCVSCVFLNTLHMKESPKSSCVLYLISPLQLSATLRSIARTNGQPCSPSARPPISLTNLEQLWWCNMVSKLFRVNSFRNLFIYTYSFIFNSHCNCRWATIGIVNMGGRQLAHIHFFNAHTSNSLTSRVGVNW